MPVAPFEKQILRLLAANRNPKSFVAGATILLRDELSPRTSRDIDIFHDTPDSLMSASAFDRDVLIQNGYRVTLDAHEETFRRAIIGKDDRSTKLEWVFDSSYRFFPIEPDAEMGYVLNFWDGATNKLLALAGRGELRDYLDVLYLDEKHLGLGALAWAACGKDVGFTPHFLIEEAQRLTHYPAGALQKLSLREPVSLVDCKKRWIVAVEKARKLFDQLPVEELGCLYLNIANEPVTPIPTSPEFPELRRHFGSVGGTWPSIQK